MAKVGRPTWRFYVYQFNDDCGNTIYIGKGSGRRLAVQKRNIQGIGHEVARFKKESDAYSFEIQLISELRPSLNKCSGGNGSKATRQVLRKDKWQSNFERIGPKRYAAQLAIAFSNLACIQPSKIEQLREVAYG